MNNAGTYTEFASFPETPYTMYLTGCSTPETRDAHRDDLGLLVTPASSVHRQIDNYGLYGADNGCYVESKKGNAFDGEAWLAWLRQLPLASCLFATLPDVLDWHTDENGKDFCVGDLDATLARSALYVDEVRALGFPVALVAQDGLERLDQIPFAVDALFLGGSDEYKLGPAAAALVAEARAAGLWVHMGRVNSAKRLRYANSIGCNSADGTMLAFGPKANWPRLQAMLDGLAAQADAAALPLPLAA